MNLAATFTLTWAALTTTGLALVTTVAVLIGRPGRGRK